MKRRHFSLLLSLLALVLLAVPPALAQDDDDTETAEIRKIIKEYIANTIFAPETLDDCLGLSDAASCKASRRGGFRPQLPSNPHRFGRP